MSYDIAKRLRGTTHEMACYASVDMTHWNKHSNACLDAANAIEALMAEREEHSRILSLAGNTNKSLMKSVLEYQVECDTLRADLDAQEDVHTQIQMQLSDERDALRAELAAEREHSKQMSEGVIFQRYVNKLVKALAERDALRALLREAREYTGYAAFYGDRIEADHAVDLCARIDAALNKEGK